MKIPPKIFRKAFKHAWFLFLSAAIALFIAGPLIASAIIVASSTAENLAPEESKNMWGLIVMAPIVSVSLGLYISFLPLLLCGLPVVTFLIEKSYFRRRYYYAGAILGAGFIPFAFILYYGAARIPELFIKLLNQPDAFFLGIVVIYFGTALLTAEIFWRLRVKKLIKPK